MSIFMAIGALFLLCTIGITNYANAADVVNIVKNSGMELDSDNNSLPDGWSQGNWGDNSVVFSYPVAGRSGSKAASVEIKSITSGDAKWFFDDVAVTPNTQYAFGDYYTANVGTELIARYANASGAYSYAVIKSLSSSTDWLKAEALITPPAGTVSMTVFHLISSVGKLSVDDSSLTAVSALDNSFDAGFVSLTFDDAWLNHKTTVAPILDSRGLKGTFYAISGETDRSINNSSFEIDADKNNIPDDWSKNVSGTNKTTFSYPVAGSTGARAASVNMTSYSNGSAFWSFKEIPVIADRDYTFVDKYKSTVATKVIARIRNTSGVTEDFVIGTAKVSSGWKKFSASFYVPEDASSITIFHQLKAKGTIAVDDFQLSQNGNPYMTSSDLVGLENSGHEIGAHSITHPVLPQLSSAAANKEIAASKTDLLNMGIKKVLSFAYPYGEYNDSIKQMVTSAGFTSGRSVDDGFAGKNSDKLALVVKNVLNTTTVAEMKSWVDQAKANKKWLIVVTHNVDNSNDPYGTTADKFTSLADYIKQTSIPVLTVTQGMDLLK